MTFLLPFLAACWPALADLHREAALTPIAALTCAEVAIRAPLHGVPPLVAVRQAWVESRFRRDVVSPKGAVGPLQVIPRYWCETTGGFHGRRAQPRAIPTPKTGNRAEWSPATWRLAPLMGAGGSPAFSCDAVGAGLRALAYYRRTAGACWRERYTGRRCG